MQKLDTILFDLDGTLIDTNHIIIESFKATFKEHFPTLDISLDTIKTFIGPTLQQTFSSYTEDPFKIKNMIESYRDFYIQYEVGNHELYPGVLDVISDLNDKGYQLGIVTSKFKIAAWPSFSHYKLQSYFDVFVSLDDVQNPKPDKEPIITALSRFPSFYKAIMIGDNQGDIQAANNASIYSAGVKWSLKGSKLLKEANPDFMLESMHDIYRVIQTINKEE